MKNIILTFTFIFTALASLSQNHTNNEQDKTNIFIEINSGLKHFLLYDTEYKNENMKSNAPYNADIFIGAEIHTKKGYLNNKVGFGINPFDYTHYYESSVNGQWVDCTQRFRYPMYNYFLNLSYLYEFNRTLSCGACIGIVFTSAQYENKAKTNSNAINFGFNAEYSITKYLKFRIEPYFNYVINKNIIRNSNVNLAFSPTIGIKLGLKYTLSKRQ